ncbi:hypothetical protein ANN_07012 [Periplaneta americana]|uniref:Uncharacterized protein n=1 Tax=Periplaneta americana TaxID=6978 RepID=A0ABQ8TF32_PERAM|nr:hypothetical protein ANN_07012 [Periplaneta americana]
MNVDYIENEKMELASVLHRPGRPIPTPPDDITLTEVIQSVPDVQTELQNHPDFVEDDTINELHFLTQKDLNDLVQDLGLSKSKAELLASRLKGWKLLQVTPKLLLKTLSIHPKPTNIDDLRVKITQASQQIIPLMLQRIWAELHHRYELCRFVGPKMVFKSSNEIVLEVNPEKTKCMIMSRDQNIARNGNITIVNLSFEKAMNDVVRLLTYATIGAQFCIADIEC